MEKAIEDEAALEIHKLMVLSTAHITKDADAHMTDLMGEDSAREVANGAVVDKLPYGWLITIGSEDPDDGVEYYPSLVDCVRYARKYGCPLLRLDSDGPKMKDLPTYNW